MKEKNQNTRLGIFVILATVLLVTALYFIGSKQNLFGNTIRVNARFYNVNGLMQGNNVRFSGIDVGTVESVEIADDSTVVVVLVIEKKIQPFIRQNALVSIGTDGLMGNKLVNINPGNHLAPVITEGGTLKTQRPVEMDEMVRTLNVTNQNMEVITGNLRHITDKINNGNSIWNLLSDTVVSTDVKSSFSNLKQMSANGLAMAGNLMEITARVNNGEGSLGAFINDTTFVTKFNRTIGKLENISDTAALIASNLSRIVQKTKKGEGNAGILLNDTMLIHDLNKSILSINKGAGSFDENMIAMRLSWPFKKYFKNKKIVDR